MKKNETVETNSMVSETDIELIRRIKAVTKKGSDAEVRRKRDGIYEVYEVKKSIVKC